MEYSRHGTVIKGQERAVACSKYEEDVKINNHTVSARWAPGCFSLTHLSRLTIGFSVLLLLLLLLTA